MERILVGFEAEMTELTIGTLSEFYEPNPPYRGRGGMSSAPSVAAVISLLDTLKKYEREEKERTAAELLKEESEAQQ